jgi:small-conductance mechanosensitive channel
MRAVHRVTKRIRRTAVAIAFSLAVPALVCAQESPQTEPQPPAQARELLRLLEDPAVRTWLEAELASAPDAEKKISPAEAELQSVADAASDRLAEVRAHLLALAAAVPRTPSETASAVARISTEVDERSTFASLLMVLAVVALGLGCEAIFNRAAAGPRRALAEQMPIAVSSQRASLHGLRLGFGIGQVASFALGSVGAFLLFDWPPLLEQTVLALLIAVLATRVFDAIVTFVLVPPGRRHAPSQPQDFRLLPMGDSAAAFWQRRFLAFVGYFALGHAIVSLMQGYGFSLEVRQVAAYALGIGLLAIAVETTWNRPSKARDGEESQARRSRAFDWVVTLYLCLLWLVWVASGGPGPFWLGVYIGFLPKAVALVGEVARRLTGREVAESAAASVLQIAIERGARAAFLIIAALWLGHLYGIDFASLGEQMTLAMRLVRGAIGSVVILLVADFVWQLIKAAIDRRISDTADAAGLSAEEVARRRRMRTLLPIFRNVLFVSVAATAALMALSALGVQIGPLIAGAGIVGVAIGFGAQTLVKDIISGIFYLLDDAFRIGDYIQSGKYMGVVEGFSLRSVKLRHHRGPVFTVPFGELGAVQNMSRDWAVDKFTIGVVYDTDLAKVKKIVKEVGARLKEDPEMGPNIIETLKMQGVEQFGEYAVQLKFKIMTTPGGHAAGIRRAAFQLIKTAFDENGIKFAFPTVQVAGGGEGSTPAAIQQVVDHLKDKSMAAAE